MTGRPVLFVTNRVPPDRAGAFAALHARTPIELALFGGRVHHATAGVADPGVPHRHVTPRAVHALAASGRYRAVVAGTAGRTALPAAWLGARRARVPFVLWSALWAELRTPAHLAARPLMAAIYRDAAAVVAYGPHVAAFARDHGARRVEIAPQPVDNAFWSAPADAPQRRAAFQVLFVGRDTPEKGVAPLLAAWRAAGLDRREAVLVVAGEGHRAARGVPGVEVVGALDAQNLRNFYAGAGVVAIPSIPSPRLRGAMGARRQRGHEPALRRHRHRCRRSRRGRTGPRRRDRPRRPGRRPRRPRRRDPAPARRSGPARAPRRGRVSGRGGVLLRGVGRRFRGRPRRRDRRGVLLA